MTWQGDPAATKKLTPPVNSNHIHEVPFSPIHQHSLLPEVKGVSHRSAFPLTRQWMNTKWKRCFLNKEFKTPPRNKHQMGETHAWEQWGTTFVWQDSTNTSNVCSQCLKAPHLRTFTGEESVRNLKRNQWSSFANIYGQK